MSRSGLAAKSNGTYGHTRQRVVWMLNHYAQDPDSAGGTRHYELARGLEAHGWKAVIIASSVELNTGRQRLRRGELMRLEDRSGVTFLWLKVPPYRSNGVRRVLNMLSYTMLAFLPTAQRKLPAPDVVIGSSVHPLAAWAGCRLARRNGVPFIFEVRDLWPQTLIDMGALSSNGLPARLLRALESHLYRRAARIVVLLPRATEYIVGAGGQQDRIVWIPNGVSIGPVAPPSERGAGDAFTLMFLGAHGRANGLSTAIDAMQILQDSGRHASARLVLVGDGPEKPALMRQAAEMGLSNVTFEPPVPKKLVPEKAVRADAFLFHLVPSPVFNYGVSANKLFDYMAAGRPVIFACEAGNNPIEEADAGLTVPPGDPARLAEAIATLVETPPERLREMGRHAREYVLENHAMDVLSRRLAQTLDEVANEPYGPESERQPTAALEHDLRPPRPGVDVLVSLSNMAGPDRE